MNTDKKTEQKEVNPMRELGNLLMAGLEAAAKECSNLQVTEVRSMEELMQVLTGIVNGNMQTEKEQPAATDKNNDTADESEAEETTAADENENNECDCNGSCECGCETHCECHCEDEQKSVPKENHFPMPKCGIIRILAPKVPENTVPEFELSKLLECFNKTLKEATELNQRYKELSRTRDFIHVVRDTPDMSDPTHMMTYLEVYNALSKILVDAATILRKTLVLAETYETDDCDAEATCVAIINEVEDVIRKVSPLSQMVDEKIKLFLECEDDEEWCPLKIQILEVSEAV